jgi:hypothetical protein
MTKKKETLVNINQGSSDELVTVPGIGPSLAERIKDGRPYQSLHDLVSVSGINEIKLASLLPYLTVEKHGNAEGETVSSLGETEAFVFLEDRNERQDAILILLGGFILGLLILMLRPRKG